MKLICAIPRFPGFPENLSKVSYEVGGTICTVAFFQKLVGHPIVFCQPKTCVKGGKYSVSGGPYNLPPTPYNRIDETFLSAHVVRGLKSKRNGSSVKRAENHSARLNSGVFAPSP
jgi:hypothetical protein